MGEPEQNMAGLRIVRSDFEVIGARGQKMQCSHFEPAEEIR
jgi:hypothetical protein